MKPLGGQGSHIGLAGQRPAQAADGVFDPALLPGGVREAEERLDAKGLDNTLAKNSLARCCTSFVKLRPSRRSTYVSVANLGAGLHPDLSVE